MRQDIVTRQRGW